MVPSFATAMVPSFVMALALASSSGTSLAVFLEAGSQLSSAAPRQACLYHNPSCMRVSCVLCPVICVLCVFCVCNAHRKMS